MPTVLIVEDSLPFRNSLKELLRDRFPSLCLEEAGDIGSAWSIINRSRPDLMFVDIRLPGENGLKLTRKVKQHFPWIRVVIVTSYDLPEYRDAASDYGADHFVTKGASCWAELTAAVQAVLGESSSDPFVRGAGCSTPE